MSAAHTDRHGPPVRPLGCPGSTDAGFTLVETLIAIVVMVFGLIGVTNLLIVGTSTNTVANHGTATAAQASEVLERLKAISFTLLVPGGSLTADVNAECDDDPPGDCVVPANFNALRLISGVALVKSRWQITAVDAQTYFIVVRSESTAPLIGPRSRAQYTTFRSCTAVDLGCPEL